jgi:NarL family two-component system response regulator YdfI
VIRVFIVAASSLARAGLQSLVENRDVKVIGIAPSIESLAGQWSEAEADVVIIEASREQFESVMDSLAASQLASEATIAVLSEFSEPRRFAEALRAGVRVLLPIDISPEQLIPALEAAAAGLTVMHPAEVSALFPAAEPISRSTASIIEPLTPRESEVLQMLAGGLANKEIATRLVISEHTVKFHVASILGKLGAGTRTEAVSLGIRRGLVLL